MPNQSSTMSLIVCLIGRNHYISWVPWHKSKQKAVNKYNSRKLFENISNIGCYSKSEIFLKMRCDMIPQKQD